MEINKKQRSVKIISEIHPQHMGSMSEAKRMILQSKLGGADFVKVQLYDSKKLFNNNDRAYLELSKDEFLELSEYSKNVGIEFFASIFNEEKIKWCEEANLQYYKIASRTVEDKKLCEKIINTGKKILISLGMYDYETNGIPFKDKNINYFYCVSKYPTNLEEIKMPNFDEHSFLNGYSDHTIGLSACIYSVSKGATFLEKHFSNNKSLGNSTQMAHVCSMDFNDLSQLRAIVDSITLLRSSKNK